ncbi:MAG: class E sortase [Acidimicrobiales bacterium]
MSHRTAAIIGAVGRTLIGMGLIVLAFAGFQLWGTGLQEARAQAALADEFEERQEAVAALLTTTVPTPTTAPTTAPDAGSTDQDGDAAPTSTTAPPPPEVAPELAEILMPDQGEVLGSIEIPAIGVEREIVEGTGRGDLQRGPGHYLGTPLPGQAGNSAIAGHRTTYGQPFHDLDLLQPGDPIYVETLQGRFRYEVLPQTDAEGNEVGHYIVHPSQIEVLDDVGDNRLTLTACHPKYSARQRIIVQAVLASEPAPLLPIPTVESANPDLADEDLSDESIDDGSVDDVANTVGVDDQALDDLGWNMEERTPTLVWALITFLVFCVGWVGARWRDTWWPWAATAPFFLASLFVCFTHLDHMLPAL